MNEILDMKMTETDFKVNQRYHTPVMLREVMEYLNPQPGHVIIDATLGTGGHAVEIVKRIASQGRLIGIDRDNESVQIAKEHLADYLSICRLIQNDFRNLDQILRNENINEVDGILLDLGISSYQLENAERGFSIKLEGPLDMRMDKNSYISAFDLVNSLSSEEISSILKNFGEERWHNRIAHCIVKEREKKPIESTSDLNHVILKAIPRRFQNQKIHPSTRSFQAFRIAVNRELEALEVVLDKCMHCMKNGARLCVISFHSLEDRIVKEKFRFFVSQGQFRYLEKKPLRPMHAEVSENPRSRSARLRIGERVK